MIKIRVTDRSGMPHEIGALEGNTLMETIREAGLDELQALCGGCCSCATCHIYVEGDSNDGLPPMSEDENDLLESSQHRIQASRLSCQISLRARHHGLQVRIAPEG